MGSKIGVSFIQYLCEPPKNSIGQAPSNEVDSIEPAEVNLLVSEPERSLQDADHHSGCEGFREKILLDQAQPYSKGDLS